MDEQIGSKKPSLELAREELRLEPLAPVNGWILDLGGGGDGIIGQLMGQRVVAIDLWKSELEESQGEALKIVMDARQLGFLDSTFEAATCFFMLMYVSSSDDREQVLREAYRVLKPGAKLYVWDVEFPAAPDDMYERLIAHLKVQLPDREINTGYGVRWSHRISAAQITGLAKRVGFAVEEERMESEHLFHLVLRK